MGLYRVTSDKLEAVPRTTFAEESLLERKDLQRLLREDISPVGDDLLVIAEEYGNWEDSNRRIDLLCLSRDASLVVVEIKRTEDGGHMELQAIRYAAMVSGLTLDEIFRVYAEEQNIDEEQARDKIREFLQPDSEGEAELNGQVRIVLVSSDFSSELTTAVLWLNRHDLDITCIRLRPYRAGSDILVDATQIIPLPEAEDYEVKVRAQEKEKRKALGVRQEILRKFWVQTIERSRAKTELLANRSTTSEQLISAGIGKNGFTLYLALVKDESRVELYISHPAGAEKSKIAFHQLSEQKDAIEAAFGGPLVWQELLERQGCRICVVLPGGWKSPESDWMAMQDRMIDALIRLEAAFRKPVQNLKP